MRLPLALLVLVALPSSLAAQAPPIVVVGPAPATSEPQAAPAVPPGYEIEGDLGGVHFHAQITTPGQALPPPVVPAPAPPPVVVQAPPPPQQVMVVQAPPPVAPVQYAPPSFAQPSYPVPPPQRADPRLRLDEGMDFVPRVALELLGGGIGFGLATGIAYLANDRPRDGGFAPTLLIASAGLMPTGISIFGGAIAGGRGRYGGAMLGELIGGGLSATILFATDSVPSDPWVMIAAIAGPALLGAIIGFEAQHGLRTARLEERIAQEGLALNGVSVAPTAQGSGATVGLSGTF
jgi:hypothetical protein